MSSHRRCSGFRLFRLLDPSGDPVFVNPELVDGVAPSDKADTVSVRMLSGHVVHVSGQADVVRSALTAHAGLCDCLREYSPVSFHNAAGMVQTFSRGHVEAVFRQPGAITTRPLVRVLLVSLHPREAVVVGTLDEVLNKLEDEK